MRISRFFVSLLLLAAFLFTAIPSSAAPVGNDAFQRTWARTDQPVSNLQTSRTWMWGPEANTGLLNEPFDGGQRTVQYFDKSRMEITDPAGDPSSLWYVTNGLLAKELVTGNLQTGPDRFEPHDPATVNVSGDPTDPHAPTYASFASRLASPPLPAGSTITQTLDREGNVGNDPSLAGQGVTAGSPVTETNHAVASVFWAFMTSSGLVFENGGTATAPLFQDPFYATGFPISEAYWSRVLVDGVSQPVLIQVFERRVLTYHPANPDGWKVEAGNVGQHYYTWRYNQIGKTTPPPAPSPSLSPSPSPTPPPGPSTSFGDGTYRVGIDIAPGTYRNSDSSGGCYWERLNGFGGELDDINANDFTTSRTIVTIKPTDVGFKSNRCGRWSLAQGAITAGQTQPFSDGTYRVGVDIAPGTWRNSDSSSGCYWARLSGFSGELDDIIANEFTESLQVVEIRPSDTGFNTSRCGTWTRISG
ncbi:hypothetical protein [Nitrolancea hollandica]|uniref:Uncharacterized protein n=1 Tax=Nitrolancea hollandica Lb TaxID=1129897 RepID=I4EMZ4_9BACT|nr:hypothetical protein [Nitrolancea hollandica]CCF86057.1 conserved exported hypothetical protein [Nitrolancea hollandica Lb]